MEYRIKFPRIWVKEDDATKFSPGEVFKAIADNDLKCLERLIKEGYPINFRDVHMMTPLHRACSRGNTDIVTLLLQHGALLNTPTGKPYKSTLHIVVAGGHLDLLKLLVKKFRADWKATDDWGWNPLHEAAVSGDKEVIRFLMKECRDLINIRDKLGRTPLLLGLLSGINQEATEVLLELGECPTNEDLVGRGCLEAAILYSSFPVVKTVLKFYLANQNLDVVSRKLLLEIISERNDRNQIIDLFPPEKKEKMLSKLILLGRI